MSVEKEEGRNLKRELAEVKKTDKGYTITPPTLKGLVLSGGGSKGISYVGMIQALDKNGDMKQLTHVSGASAGAMTASLLAIGMPHKDIKEFVEKLNIINLLDKGGIDPRAKGDRFRNMFDVIYMMQLKKHLNSLDTKLITPSSKEEEQYLRVKLKIDLYEQALEEEGIIIDNIDDIINLVQSTKELEKMDRAFKKLPQEIKNEQGELIENPRITFNDLRAVRDLLPEEEQHLIKNLSVVVTNQTKSALETYSEKSTPNQSIAQVVQWSGAHPLLFVPGKNATGESIADGGILDNMPEIDGLKREETLCVKAESSDSYHKRVKRAQTSSEEKLSGFHSAILDPLINKAIGGRWLDAKVSGMNREKVFYHIDNMIYIDTGEVKTTSTSPTEKQIERAIDNGYQATNKLLGKQKETFSTPLIAILYLGIDKLDIEIQDVNTEPKLLKAAVHAKTISLLQQQIVNDLHNNNYKDVQNYFEQIDDALHYAGLFDEDLDKAFSLCIKQVSYLSEGKLDDYLITVNTEDLAAQKPSWTTRILEFLYMPIEWVLSSPKTPEIKQEITTEFMNTSSKFKERIQKLMSHEDQKQKNSETDEETNKKCNSPGCG
jgi:VPS inhibitor protein D